MKLLNMQREHIHKDIEIRSLTPADEPMFVAGVKLLNVTQGQDLFEPSYLRQRANDKDSYVVAAIMEGEIVGVGVACLIQTFDYYEPFDADISHKLRDRKVGSFATLCLKESLRGQGIGQKMSWLRLAWLKAQGCEVVLGVSWVSGLGHTSDRVFEKVGFKPLKKVEHFYYKSSSEKPFYCPGCRTSPCTCAAILYRLDL